LFIITVFPRRVNTKTKVFFKNGLNNTGLLIFPNGYGKLKVPHYFRIFSGCIIPFWGRYC